MKKLYMFTKDWLYMSKGTIITFNQECSTELALYEQIKNHLVVIPATDVPNMARALASEQSDIDIDLFLDSLSGAVQ